MSRFPVAPLGIAAVLILCQSSTRGADPEPVVSAVRAVQDPVSGQVMVGEAERPVLQYNYQTVQPPAGFVESVAADSRKYAVARSNYIHPLFGLDGETLTNDWSKDHPHHRGIYWAWPEVDCRGDRGDLHALQRVFSRPTGQLVLKSGADYAEIEAENLWKWEDKTPIVREMTTIRVWRSTQQGRLIDLTFRFEAIDEDVALARRQQQFYGGLNIRLASSARERVLWPYTDPAEASPRRAWAEATGVWPGGSGLASLAIFEHPTNPQYPGDWIQYPDLPWLQPTFPRTGVRYVLKKGQPLDLAYRLWIHRGGRLAEEAYIGQWQAFEQSHRVSQPDPLPLSRN